LKDVVLTIEKKKGKSEESFSSFSDQSQDEEEDAKVEDDQQGSK
jgi:hypothetical protein